MPAYVSKFEVTQTISNRLMDLESARKFLSSYAEQKTSLFVVTEKDMEIYNLLINIRKNELEELLIQVLDIKAI